MRAVQAGVIREFENERIGKFGKEEILSVYSTLPKFEMKKRCVGTVRSIRKVTEKNGRAC